MGRRFSDVIDAALREARKRAMSQQAGQAGRAGQDTPAPAPNGRRGEAAIDPAPDVAGDLAATARAAPATRAVSDPDGAGDR